MNDVSAEDAIEAVRVYAELDEGIEFIAAVIPGFPEFWYVTGENSGRPTVGGAAFIVNRASREITAVPASRPPRVNCEQARQTRSTQNGN